MPSAVRSSETHRTDLDATRTGSEPAWALMARAFASSASRSTNANGAGLAPKIVS